MIESLLTRLARSASRHCRAVVGAACLLLAVTPFVTRGLRLDADASSILSTHDPALTAYLEHKALFGETSPVLVLVEDGEVAPELALTATRALRDALLASPEVVSLSSSNPATVPLESQLSLLRAALLNGEPEHLAAFLDSLEPAGIRRSLRRTRTRLIGIDSSELRSLLMRDPLGVLQFVRPFFATRLGPALDLPPGTTLFFLQVRTSAEDSASCRSLVEDLRARSERILRRSGASAMHVELSGLPILTGSSAAVLEREMMQITAVALGALLLLLALTLRRWRLIVLCFFPLLVSLSALLVIARLLFNPLYFLSIGFAAIVCGLGLDVGLHLSARLSRHAHSTAHEEAVVTTMVECAPPVSIGVLSTAAAFLALLFAANRGLTQFALLSASGLVATLLVTLILFPATARLLWRPARHAQGSEWFSRLVRAALEPVLRHPGAAAAIALAVCALSLPWAMRFRLDLDPLRLYPEKLAALETARKITHLLGASVTSTVELSFWAPSIEAGLNRQAELDHELELLCARGHGAAFSSASSFLVTPHGRTAAARAGTATRLAESRDAFFANLDELGFAPTPELQRYFGLLEAVLTPSPPRVEDCPLAVPDGSGYRFLSLIWPAAEETQVFATAATRELSRTLGAWSDEHGFELEITSPTTVLDRLNQTVRRDFLRVSWLSLSLVCLVMLVCLRDVGAAFVCLLPVALALLLAAATVVLLGIPFTPSALAFAAIVLGVGIDDAVHIVHRVRSGLFRSVTEVVAEIAPVISLTTLSSVIGFGSLALSSHPVVSSVGLVVALGIAACWMQTLLLLPFLASRLT